MARNLQYLEYSDQKIKDIFEISTKGWLDSSSMKTLFEVGEQTFPITTSPLESEREGFFLYEDLATLDQIQWDVENNDIIAMPEEVEIGYTEAQVEVANDNEDEKSTLVRRAYSSNEYMTFGLVHYLIIRTAREEEEEERGSDSDSDSDSSGDEDGGWEEHSEDDPRVDLATAVTAAAFAMDLNGDCPRSDVAPVATCSSYSELAEETQWSEGEKRAMDVFWPLLVRAAPPDVLLIADPEGSLLGMGNSVGPTFVGNETSEMRLVGALREILAGGHLGYEEVKDVLKDVLPLGTEDSLTSGVSESLLSAFLIGQRMNRETDRELKAYCLAFDDELGAPPVADVKSLTHYGEPYDGNTRFFRSTLFVATDRSCYGESSLLHGVEWMPPKGGVTEEQMLKFMGANTSLSAQQAKELIEPLLMLMRRRGVHSGLVIKGEEGALSMTTRVRAPTASKGGFPVNYSSGFRSLSSDTALEADGVSRQSFNLEVDARNYGFEPTDTPRTDRSVSKNIELGLSALRGKERCGE